MDKNKKAFLILIIFLLILVVVIMIYRTKSQGDIEKNNINNEENNNIAIKNDAEQDFIQFKEESSMYQDDSSIEQLKEEYNLTGDSNLYQIETEKDGRKVLNIKPSIQFKVAYAGMIKKSMPSIKEIDSIYENIPTLNGVYIEEESRNKVLNILNNNEILKAEYKVNDKGYLKQNDSNKMSDTDQLIKKLINGNKQFIICLSSTCYTVDVVTGKIVKYPYNDLDKYQTYEYFEDENKMIIFISENKEKALTDKVILKSVLELFKLKLE